MDISVGKYETDINRSGSFSATLRVVREIVRWLIGLVILTDEERTKAGIYLGGEGRGG
jgi:hypothetical protein